jgi:hypothetical protein
LRFFIEHHFDIWPRQEKNAIFYLLDNRCFNFSSIVFDKEFMFDKMIRMCTIVSQSLPHFYFIFKYNQFSLFFCCYQWIHHLKVTKLILIPSYKCPSIYLNTSMSRYIDPIFRSTHRRNVVMFNQSNWMMQVKNR